MIVLDDVEDRIRDCLQRKQLTSHELEMILIEETLKKFSGNKTHAAVALGISVRTVRNKLNRKLHEAEASENFHTYI